MQEVSLGFVGSGLTVSFLLIREDGTIDSNPVTGMWVESESLSAFLIDRDSEVGEPSLEHVIVTSFAGFLFESSFNSSIISVVILDHAREFTVESGDELFKLVDLELLLLFCTELLLSYSSSLSTMTSWSFISLSKGVSSTLDLDGSCVIMDGTDV